MRIYRDTYLAIKKTVGSLPPETGGLLGKNRHGIICAFHPDLCRKSGVEYAPDTDLFNRVLAEWAARGVSFAGIVHSHPCELRQLSEDDVIYVENIMSSTPDIEAACFPIACSDPTEGFTLNCYLAEVNPEGITISESALRIIS